jgi:hypothetical protein
VNNLWLKVSKQQGLLAGRVIKEVIVAINLPEAQETKVITVTEVIEQITQHVIKKLKRAQPAKKAKRYLHLWCLESLMQHWTRQKLKLK